MLILTFRDYRNSDPMGLLRSQSWSGQRMYSILDTAVLAVTRQTPANPKPAVWEIRKIRKIRQQQRGQTELE